MRWSIPNSTSSVWNACGSPTAATFAERAGTNRKWVHNRVLRGLNWIEADDASIRVSVLVWDGEHDGFLTRSRHRYPRRGAKPYCLEDRPF